MSKKIAQRIHAKRRAAERYGLALNKEQYDQMNELARSATVLERQSNRLTIRRIVMDGSPIRVVYDASRHQIVTFLPQKRRDFDDDLSHLERLVPNNKPVE